MGGSWNNTLDILAGQLDRDRSIKVSASAAGLLLGLAGLSALSSELVTATKLIRGLVLITLVSTAAFTTATILRSQYGDVPFQICFVVTNFFSKIASCAVLMALAPTKKHRLPTLVVELTAVFWVAYSINWIARNTLPVTGPVLLQTEQGVNLLDFWYGYAKYDILTDVGIILSPINCMRGTALPSKKQVIVSLAFLPRVLSSLSALARWWVLNTVAQDGGDVSLAEWLYTVATISQIFFAVLAAFAPHLTPLRDIIWSTSQAVKEEDNNQGIDKAAKSSRSNGVEVLAANNLVGRVNQKRKIDEN